MSYESLLKNQGEDVTLIMDMVKTINVGIKTY